MDTKFRKKEATTDYTDNTDVWGAPASAAWFESLAVASRPLQRRVVETIFFFTEGNEGNEVLVLVEQNPCSPDLLANGAEGLERHR